MYHYEVFVRKGDGAPAALSTFEQTMETRFFEVYSKAVPEEENSRLEAELQVLQNGMDIGYFFWAFIPKEVTPTKNK